MEEVCKKTSLTESQIKTLVIQHQLREFRDGDRIFFKSEDVDKIVPPKPITLDEAKTRVQTAVYEALQIYELLEKQGSLRDSKTLRQTEARHHADLVDSNWIGQR